MAPNCTKFSKVNMLPYNKILKKKMSYKIQQRNVVWHVSVNFASNIIYTTYVVAHTFNHDKSSLVIQFLRGVITTYCTYRQL